MTQLPTPYGAICDTVRCGDRSDGALIAVFLNRERQIVLTIEIGEGTGHVDELFLRHLVAIVTDIGVAEVIFAVSRAPGRPVRVDKLMWRELGARLAGSTTSLLDVIVVGDGRWWSAASGRTRVLGHEQRHAPLAGLDVEDHPVGADVGEVGLIRHQDPAAEKLHAGRGVPRDR